MNVISFTLFWPFGRDPGPLYSVGAIRNAQICADLYPDWLCRFYVGRSIDDETVATLRSMPNVDVFDMPDAPEDWSALNWRFLSLFDGGISLHMFRDADSRPDEREAAAVAEWIASGRRFHIMRDHPEHTAPMMAGMWGCTKAAAERIAPNLVRAGREDSFADQAWLASTVYPAARQSMLVHDEFELMTSENPQPFPLPRRPLDNCEGWRFVGQGFDENDMPLIPADALRVPAPMIGVSA